MAVLFDSGIFSVIGLSSELLVGANLYWYAAGTTTPLATYTTEALSVANPNPVPADAAGRFRAIWLQAADYKLELKSAAGVTLVTRDNITGITALDELADDDGASLVTYTAPGFGAEPRDLEGKVAEIEISVLDYMSDAARAAVEAYSFAVDVTTPVNRAVDYAYRNSLRLKFPPGGYLVSQIILPDDPAVDPRAYGFEMVGAGRGEAFVVNNPRGTVIRGSSATLPTLKFTQTGPNQGSGVLLIHNIRFEGTQNAGIAVADFEAIYGVSHLYDCDFYQFGAGDGINIGFMATGEMERCYLLCGYDIGGSPSWAVPGRVARPGTGLIFRNDISCGLATFRKITSRGFGQGYDIGNTSGGVITFSPRFEACEVSACTNGFHLRERVWKGVLDSCYIEASSDSTVVAVLNEGNYTTITDCEIGILGSASGASAIFIDDSSTLNDGTVITNNNFQGEPGGRFTMVKIASSGTYGGPGKVVTGNSFIWAGSGGAVPNAVAIEISGINPRIHFEGNAFTPRGPWIGASTTKKISDLSTTGLGGTGHRGLSGLGIEENGDQEFVKLNQGAIGFGIPQDDLADAAISAGTLTLGGGSYFRLDLTAPTNISNIVKVPGKTNQGDLIIIECLDGNATFLNSASIILHGAANYTPPAGGAVLQFVSRFSFAGLPVFKQIAPPAEF